MFLDKFAYPGEYVRQLFKRVLDLAEVENSHVHIVRTFCIDMYDPETKNIGSGIYA